MTIIYRLGNQLMADEFHAKQAGPSGRDAATVAANQLGPLCRCLPCCCRPGRGHNHPDFEALYERLMGRLE